MQKQEVLDFLRSAEEVSPRKLLKQHWNQPSFSYMRQPRPDFGLMLLLSGSVEFAGKKGSLTAKAGDVVFLPKGSHYEARFFRSSAPVENYLVNFDGPYPGLSAEPVMLLENAPLSCIKQFRELVEENYDRAALRSKGLLYLLLDALASGETPATDAGGSLAKAQALLRQEYSVPEIAAACCLSESGLRRLFRQRLGLSPAQYRIRYKLQQAMYLLESTELTVGEIADSLNFFDAAYFCRLFRAHTGLTPKQYAQNKKL